MPTQAETQVGEYMAENYVDQPGGSWTRAKIR